MLITGGGSGIGRGLAEAFTERGNHVIVTGRTERSLEDVRHANPAITAMAYDITNEDDIAALAERVVREHPDLDSS